MGKVSFNGLNSVLVQEVIAEKIQKRRRNRWRRAKGVEEAVRRRGIKAKNILTYSSHYISRKIVRIAE